LMSSPTGWRSSTWIAMSAHGSTLTGRPCARAARIVTVTLRDGMIERWQKLVKDSQQDLMKEINEIRSGAGQGNVWCFHKEGTGRCGL